MCMIKPIGPIRAAIFAALIGLRAVYQYIGRHKLPFAVFGGLLAVIAAVWMNAKVRGLDDLAAHILNREFAVHIGLGFALYGLFGRLLLVAERKRGRHLDWLPWYFVPLCILLSINATNEWLVAMTGRPDGWPEGRPLTWFGGDWKRAQIMQSAPTMLKSIADMAAWAFGALACAWRDYFMGERLWLARADYLHRNSKDRMYRSP